MWFIKRIPPPVNFPGESKTLACKVRGKENISGDENCSEKKSS